MLIYDYRVQTLLQQRLLVHMEWERIEFQVSQTASPDEMSHSSFICLPATLSKMNIAPPRVLKAVPSRSSVGFESLSAECIQSTLIKARITLPSSLTFSKIMPWTARKLLLVLLIEDLSIYRGKPWQKHDWTSPQNLCWSHPNSWCLPMHKEDQPRSLSYLTRIFAYLGVKRFKRVEEEILGTKVRMKASSLTREKDSTCRCTQRASNIRGVSSSRMDIQKPARHVVVQRCNIICMIPYLLQWLELFLNTRTFRYVVIMNWTHTLAQSIMSQ